MNNSLSVTYNIFVEKKLSELNKIKLFVALGVVLTFGLGAISHFIYQWSGKNVIAGLLFATNESIWEHIKLALLPMFVIFIIGGFLFAKKVNNYFFAVFCCLLVTINFVIFSFLGYTIYTRKSILPFDITIFALSIILGFLTAYRIFFLKKFKYLNVVGLIGIIGIAIAFFTCTYHAPQIFLFEELYVF